MSTVLNFFLWLTRRSDVNLADYESSLTDTIALLHKIKGPPSSSKFVLTLGEFLMVYTGAQYLYKAMASNAGIEYINDIPGSTSNADWIEKQKKYFIIASQLLIKECESKFEDLPDFAKERMWLDKQLQPF